jgi:predicted HD phosphohydrolase
VEETVDPYQLYRLLLLPLDKTRQSVKYHPEGDVLYHSLQVFERAREERPYDEEFLLAALLHDVGKGIDPGNHVTAALEALDGLITDRTRFFIEHHMDAHAYREGSIGARLKQKLEASADFDDLMLLNQCDRAGREAGVLVGTLDEALDFLRELERSNDH